MVQMRFWVFIVIALLFLSMGSFTFIRALQGGNSIQYVFTVCAILLSLLFVFLAQAMKAGKWPWE